MGLPAHGASGRSLSLCRETQRPKIEDQRGQRALDRSASRDRQLRIVTTKQDKIQYVHIQTTTSDLRPQLIRDIR